MRGGGDRIAKESVAGNSPEKGFSLVPTPWSKEGGWLGYRGKGRYSLWRGFPLLSPSAQMPFIFK